MLGYNLFWQESHLLVYLMLGIGFLVVAVPVGLFMIRRLNETWLDTDWQATRREREQNRIESIIVTKSRPLVSTCLWGLLIQVVFMATGAVLGALIYLPGPLDGWFIFTMLLFGGSGMILGLFVNLVLLLARWPDS